MWEICITFIFVGLWHFIVPLPNSTTIFHQSEREARNIQSLLTVKFFHYVSFVLPDYSLLTFNFNLLRLFASRPAAWRVQVDWFGAVIIPTTSLSTISNMFRSWLLSLLSIAIILATIFTVSNDKIIFFSPSKSIGLMTSNLFELMLTQ
jgi:hypothetical protein